MAAHQAPPCLGFSRQEHWSGLPFPPPMHESEKWKWKVKVKSPSRVRLFATPWTAAYQAPPSMGFSRQEYWSGVPLTSLNHCSILSLKIPNYLPAGLIDVRLKPHGRWGSLFDPFLSPVWTFYESSSLTCYVLSRSVVSDFLWPHAL